MVQNEETEEIRLYNKDVLKRYYLNKFMQDVKNINHLELVSMNH